MRLPAVLVLALALVGPVAGCWWFPASGPPQASLADVAEKGDALAISDALEKLIADGKDTASDREFALRAVRAHPAETAEYAFARAAVAGRVVQARGLGGLGLVLEVERWALKSKKLDPNFRNGAAARMLGTLYVMAPSSATEHGSSEEGLEMLEDLVKRFPTTWENHLRFAEAFISLNDPGSATPHLCLCQIHKAELRRDDQALLEHLFADAGHPQCPATTGDPQKVPQTPPAEPAKHP